MHKQTNLTPASVLVRRGMTSTGVSAAPSAFPAAAPPMISPAVAAQPLATCQTRRRQRAISPDLRPTSDRGRARATSARRTKYAAAVTGLRRRGCFKKKKQVPVTVGEILTPPPGHWFACTSPGLVVSMDVNCQRYSGLASAFAWLR